MRENSSGVYDLKRRSFQRYKRRQLYLHFLTKTLLKHKNDLHFQSKTQQTPQKERHQQNKMNYL